MPPTEEMKAKLMGKFKLVVANCLAPYMKYGFQEKHELPSAARVIDEAALQLAKAWSGEEVPIDFKLAEKKAAERGK